MAVSGNVTGMERRVLEAVIYERDPPIARIILNRVDRANTKDATLVTEVDDCLHEADRDREIKVVIIKANGKGFCGGHVARWAPPTCFCGRRYICGNFRSRRSRRFTAIAWVVASIWAC
jgi:enoyl-CoA hydratase/carnithine racemase